MSELRVNELSKITRVEVIDHRESIGMYGIGRAFVSGIDPNMKVETELQDNGRTLKVFLSDREESK